MRRRTGGRDASPSAMDTITFNSFAALATPDDGAAPGPDGASA